MVSASKLLAGYVAALPAVAVWVSRTLSVVVLLGLACTPFLQWASPGLAPRSAAAPVEMVRTVPVPYLDADLPAAPADVLKVAERRSRRREPEPEREEKAPATGDRKAKAKASADANKDEKDEEDEKNDPPEPDQWSETRIIAALRDCLRRLAPLDVEIAVADPVKKERCGAAAPIVLKRLGAGEDGVELRPAPTLNCAMVAHLNTWVEDTLQPAARELLGSPVVRIRNAAGYACRNRVGAGSRTDRLSEHALANAIDIAGFETADGRVVDVLGRWGPTRRDLREAQESAWNAAEEAKAAAKAAEREAAKAARAVPRAKQGAKRERAEAEAAKKKEAAADKRQEARQKEAEWRKTLARTAEMRKLGRGTDAEAISVANADDEDEELNPAEALFLRRLHEGACGTFGTVLGPEANEAHRNHFHFDLARRKRRAFCE